MIAPVPADSPEPARPTSVGAADHRQRTLIARRWAYQISGTAYVPLSRDVLENELLALVDRVFDAVRSEPFECDDLIEVGERLVELNCTGPTSLRCTVEVLGKALSTGSETASLDRLTERVVAVLSALVSGYSDAIRQFIFTQQEGLNRALLKAASDARGRLVASEHRFDQVFRTSASGIALTGLDGQFVRVNDALSEMVGYPAAELTRLRLFDLAHPDDLAALRQSQHDLLSGAADRIRQSARLVARDGELATVTLSVSALRDTSGEPTHLVAVLHDATELKLLQNELNRQALHDVLTGLPNRQFLTTRLETVLHHPARAAHASLLHLDLDAFSQVTTGLGRPIGDALLRVVSERLVTAFQGEQAMVARIGGDEFAVLVEHSPGTPDLVRMVELVKEELAEPVFLDGHGVAVSASIGVVQPLPAGADPQDVLRAAESALRRARASGHRQWEVYDPERDRADQERSGLAAAMPGAWESGEISVLLEPVVDLALGHVVGVEALLRWDHPELGPIPHSRCVALAESTGLTLPMGGWLLRTAAERLDQLPGDPERRPWLTMALTPDQAADPDLMKQVLGVLSATGLSRDRLRLGFPACALVAERGETVENLKLLAYSGIAAEVHGFGGADDVVCLEDLPVDVVRVSRRLVDRQARRPVAGSLLGRALVDLVQLVHSAGVLVAVDGIRTAEQADWWRSVGADHALGGFFTLPDAVPHPRSG